MAYVDFTAPVVASPLAPRHDPAPRVAQPSGLGALEWSVIAVARNDSLASLRAPGRMAVAMASLFGTRPSNKLADPRLEALRRIAVLTWHHGAAVPGQEIARFLAAGFSADDYETLLASIATARRGRRRR